MFVIMTLINLSWPTTKEDNKLALRRILVRSLAGHSGQILSEKYRLSLNSQRPQSRFYPARRCFVNCAVAIAASLRRGLYRAEPVQATRSADPRQARSRRQTGSGR